jgi:hypothetical protein
LILPQQERTPMTDQPRDRQAAERLRQAFEPSADSLTHEQAEALLPAFVEAELGGEDVDSDPAFAELLQHLDHCERCTSLYAALAEDMAVFTSDAPDPPQVTAAAPEFFTTVRSSEGVILRVLRGLVRRFELELAMPRFGPSLATLSGDQMQLLDDTLVDVTGTPRITIVLEVGTASATLRAVLRDATSSRPWQVQLMGGDFLRTVVTNERGVATIADIPLDNLESVTLRYSELPPDGEH